MITLCILAPVALLICKLYLKAQSLFYSCEMRSSMHVYDGMRLFTFKSFSINVLYFSFLGYSLCLLSSIRRFLIFNSVAGDSDMI